jgi:hypothetical protein
MDVKQFKENLLLYGADVHQWPEEIRNVGLQALENSSELQFLVREEARFENILKNRKYEEPGSNLEQRIISAALQVKKSPSLSVGAFLSELLAEFKLPKPVWVAVSILVIGFAIGFLNPRTSTLTEQEQINLQAFLYDEEEVP